MEKNAGVGQIYSNFLRLLGRSTNLLSEDPVRAEIFSVERLEHYAGYLALELQVNPEASRGHSLVKGVRKSSKTLRDAYQVLADALRSKHSLSPAAEGFVDNFFIVEEQIRQIKQDLPPNYSRQLPKLATGELQGYPRVYALALAILAHTDSRIDADTLRRFIAAFQSGAALSIGELWAIPIALRIALVEQLRTLAVLIVNARKKREEADVFADLLLKEALRSERKPDFWLKLLTNELERPGNFDRAFIVQLTLRLRDQDPDMSIAFDWIEEKLKSLKTTTARVEELEHHRQAAAQVTVGNIISSMRLLSALDWREFFESVDLVHAQLLSDPSAVYSKMDFQTRDRYRHVIERVAKGSQLSEIDVAKRAIQLAMESRQDTLYNFRRTHVGYFLIGGGLFRLEKDCHYRSNTSEQLTRGLTKYPTFFYLGSVLVVGVSLLLGLICVLDNFEVGTALIVTLALLSALPISEFSLSLVNHLCSLFVRPSPLPKMDTKGGIPDNSNTMVVIPTLFTSPEYVLALLERLQIHYLGNQDPNISLALLGDFGDAGTETLSSDAALLRIALAGIEELNLKYAKDSSSPIFYLFCRKRQWNVSEQKWIGWERKRGKIEEFNRLLRGATHTSFSTVTASTEFLAKIQYVITLDSDTQLPRDAAHQLIGTILHPLNQPHFEFASQRVSEGYAILQPRVSVAPESASKTHFSRIFTGNTGIDPYSTSTSDVYQDLFCEGSFVGKGLYVVDALDRSLAGRIPENSILSHDLFEGCYARSALVNDVELFDDFPSDFDTYAKRLHRWVRGDWQIAPWIFPRVPQKAGASAGNDLSILSRWKIFDNLRRSLVAPSALGFLIVIWIMLPQTSLIWTLFILAIHIFPVYAPVTNGILLRRKGVSLRDRMVSDWWYTREKLEQAFFMIAFMPEFAWIQIDAVARTLYRKMISKQKLLEWVSFAQSQSSRLTSLQLRDWLSPAPLVATFVVLFAKDSRFESLKAAAPFLMVWTAAPAIKSWIRKIAAKPEVSLSEEQRIVFRGYARRTWHFFETFVGSEDNWLAPDNFQEDPIPVVAHRTSPTNIGLHLLSAASAYDFGYLGLNEFVETLEKTFATLGRMQRLHGHFYNWFDTRTLDPLRPMYVSTVDSGNLAGHLIVLKQALLELDNKSVVHERACEGLSDTLREVVGSLSRIENVAQGYGDVTLENLQRGLSALIEFLYNTRVQPCARSLPSTIQEWSQFLATSQSRLEVSRDILDALAATATPDKFLEAKVWMTAALNQILEFRRDISVLARGIGSMPVKSTLKSLQPDSSLSMRISHLAARCESTVIEMDFRFLYDEQRKIFVIGYNVADARRDNSYYDLLASESRLASFMAIAKEDVSKEHWFRLGRQMTAVGGSRALLSWSATMFEYLMPLLVMRRYGNTLLDETYDSIVARQIAYGAQNQVPWGISEAGYNARDLNLNYQYGPFGIPGLGFKRGLSDDLVVSPYSTFLASVIDPLSALSNLRAFEEQGLYSRHGFYESVDYTLERLPKGRKRYILRSYMAHHQGMSFVSLNNLLHNNVMPRRFHNEPRIQATQLLLQERIPLSVDLKAPRQEEVSLENIGSFNTEPNPRIYTDVNLPTPRTQLLSNGSYSVMISTAGSGYSRYGLIALNRWREDVTRDPWGHFFYIRNFQTGALWSAGYQPTLAKPLKYEATFAEDKVDFWREDTDVVTHTEIIVSPEDSVELRRISITNTSSETQDYEITSFIEIALAPHSDDVSHPAFSNLFVQTEFVHEDNVLLANRRRRSNGEPDIWGFHVFVAEGETVGALQYETDRSRFLGRGHTAFNPTAVFADRSLSNTVGSVLDPVFSLRHSLRIRPGETARALFATGIAQSRDDALRLADKYHDTHIFPRETELVWTKTQVQLRHLNLTTDEAHTFQRLGGRIVYSDPSLRPRSKYLAQNSKSQTNLWAYGISGDMPIVLVRISDEKDILVVRTLLRAHEYLRLKGLCFDLVILNEHGPSYIQSLQDELYRQIRISGAQALQDKPGGIFVRRRDVMPLEDVILLNAVARVNLGAEKGALGVQLQRRPIERQWPDPLVPAYFRASVQGIEPSTPGLNFFNGIGGFSDDGKTYVIVLKTGQSTPAPWINVIANESEFGFLVSESGSGYTWSENSRENRLSPWSNDSVSDPAGEAIYIRDEKTGEFWTPTPLPIREPESYVVRHGQGYSRFQHTSHEISQDLTLFVTLRAGVKVSRLVLKNLGQEPRHLSVTSFVEWVLGTQRGASGPHVVTELDVETGAIFATNAYNNEFATRVAFSEMSESNRSFTCDRKEFLGRNGSLARPEGLLRETLSGQSGAGLDPCTAYQARFQLDPGEEREILVLLGEADNREQARELVKRYRVPATAKVAFDEVTQHWDDVLNVVQVRTPDPAMNTLTNRWLVYQTLSCRLWARSAFYQSGGAFGFRDQMQDVMALVYSQPLLARDHIVKVAAHQFEEGDVQHWWHPPTGRGVRTHCSDDLFWLPYVCSFYIRVTGDRSVLGEMIPYLQAPELLEGQDDSYTQPAKSDQVASLYDHCVRALDRGLKVGAHGLPLMGSGDWNDGMNRVGHRGIGESVWLAWFLMAALKDFIPHCELAEDTKRVAQYRQHLESLKWAVEKNSWDGDWYHRAYTDDGEILGSAKNLECRIDSIAQSWAVLSGMGDPQRSFRAMSSVDQYLIDRENGLVKLFAPPFDRGQDDPGYIKGYVPGVRENGGQYTHAAIWALMAFAKIGDGDRAGELFGLINPIQHSSTRTGFHRYKVEPYVVAADIYGLSPHVGRGGWTWYTGSASLMYRAALEFILGFRLSANSFQVIPCVPKEWNDFEIVYRYKSSRYKIAAKRKNPTQTLAEIVFDGVGLPGHEVPLLDDGNEHSVFVYF